MEDIIKRMSVIDQDDLILETNGEDDYDDIESEEEQDQFRSIYNDPNKMTPYVLKFSNWKYLVHFLAQFQMFGNWYCFQQPAILSVETKDVFNNAGLDFTWYSYALIYTVTYAPNLIVPAFTGLAVDKFGLRSTMLTLQAICMIGQFVQCTGGHHYQTGSGVHIMLLGRAIYGSGMISMMFCTVMFFHDWFPAPNNTALGFIFTIPYLGVVMCSFLSPALFFARNPDWETDLSSIQGFGGSYFNGFYIQIVCTIATLILFSIDKYAEQNLIRMKKAWAKISNDKNATEVIEYQKPKFNPKDIYQLGKEYWLNVASSLFQCIANTGFMMWIPLRYLKRYGFGYDGASYALAVPFFIGAVFCPITGWLIERHGKMMLMSNVACVLLIFTFVIYYILDWNPEENEKGQFQIWAFIPLITLGLSNSIFSLTSNAQIINVLVKEQIYGTASGIHYTIQTMGLIALPLIIAGWQEDDMRGHDHTQYNYPTVFFIIMSILALCFNLGLQYFDLKYKRGLLNHKDPREFKKELISKKQNRKKRNEKNQKGLSEEATEQLISKIN